MPWRRTPLQKDLEQFATLTAQLRGGIATDHASEDLTPVSRVTAQNRVAIMHYVAQCAEGVTEREYARRFPTQYRVLQATFLAPHVLAELDATVAPARPTPRRLIRRLGAA